MHLCVHIEKCTQRVRQLNIYLTRLAYLAAKLWHTHKSEKEKFGDIVLGKFFYDFCSKFQGIPETGANRLLGYLLQLNATESLKEQKQMKNRKKTFSSICMWFRYYVRRFMCKIYCFSCETQYERVVSSWVTPQIGFVWWTNTAFRSFFSTDSQTYSLNNIQSDIFRFYQ